MVTVLQKFHWLTACLALRENLLIQDLTQTQANSRSSPVNQTQSDSGQFLDLIWKKKCTDKVWKLIIQKTQS